MNRRVFLLIADNERDAQQWLYSNGVRANLGRIRLITSPHDRKKILGLDAEDTPWHSMRIYWNAEMRDLYNTIKLRYGPVWSEASWLEALKL